MTKNSNMMFKPIENYELAINKKKGGFEIVIRPTQITW